MLSVPGLSCLVISLACASVATRLTVSADGATRQPTCAAEDSIKASDVSNVLQTIRAGSDAASHRHAFANRMWEELHRTAPALRSATVDEESWLDRSDSGLPDVGLDFDNFRRLTPEWWAALEATLWYSGGPAVAQVRFFLEGADSDGRPTPVGFRDLIIVQRTAEAAWEIFEKGAAILRPARGPDGFLNDILSPRSDRRNPAAAPAPFQTHLAPAESAGGAREFRVVPAAQPSSTTWGGPFAHLAAWLGHVLPSESVSAHPEPRPATEKVWVQYRTATCAS